MPEINKILNKITKGSVFGLVFLLPLFLLPFGTTALDFQKQMLLILLAMIGLAAFILKVLVEKGVKIKRNLLNPAVLLFIVIMGASTIFSWDPAQSFFGPVSTASSGFITWLSLAIFFFLVINFFDDLEEVKKLAWTALGSALVAALYGFLQAWNIFLLPWQFTRSQGFNTIGRFNSLALYMGALLPLVITLWLATKKQIVKIGLGVLGTFALLILTMANYWLIWIATGVGMASLIVLIKMTPAHINNNWIILPVVLLVIAFSFALIRPTLPGLPNLPIEASPSYGSVLEIGKKIITGAEGRIKAALGTGPGTFTFLYDLFKPEEVSTTAFWSVNFQSASSQMLGMLGTTGILGLLSFLGVIVTFAYMAVKRLISTKQNRKFTATKAFKIGLFSSWLVLVAGKFLYPSSLSLEFLFWLVMALFTIIILNNDK